MRYALPLVLLAATALSACSLQPKLELPAPPVPAALPTGGVYPAASAPAAAEIGYRDVIVDTRLRGLIDQALVNNRDLRVAAANIVAARAQYRIQRADLAPSVDLGAGASYADRGSASTSSSANAGGGTRSYSVDIGMSAYEIDFFGRIRSLTDEALNRYLATESAARATRLTLIADVADAWSSYAADKTLLAVAEQTAANAETSVGLTRARLDGGVAPRTDLRQAETVLASAQADVAQQRTAVAQDLNALQLLVGAAVDAAALPASIEETDKAFAALSAGVDSSVLLHRPDIIQAEYELRAANANIGAARAAMFPRISLTATAGVASNALSALFGSGTFSWSTGSSLSLPLFNAGALRAGVDVSKAQLDVAVATYERSIQSAFRETADALARQGTLDDQIAAQRRNLAAAEDTNTLTDARYRGGVDTYLSSLVAQRSLYTAQRGMVGIELTQAVNRVALLRALGGGA